MFIHQSNTSFQESTCLSQIRFIALSVLRPS